MTKTMLVALVSAFIALYSLQPAVGADQGGQDGVRAAINHYFQGHATGDASHFRLAFLPTAHIEGNRQGKFTSWTLEEYCAAVQGKACGR